RKFSICDIGNIYSDFGLSLRVSPHELDVALFLEELEVTDEVELLRTHLELGKSDHLGEIPLTVAPVERRDRRSQKGCRREVLAFYPRKVVEGDRAHTLAAHDDLLGFRVARRYQRCNRADAECGGTIADRALEPHLLLGAEGG